MFSNLAKPLFCILCMAFAFAASALPTKTINGRQYYTYTVQPQETVYSLCRKFGVTREQLLATNPSIAEGLKAYQEILIPASNSGEQRTHTVQKSETAYGISKQYGLTLEQFYELNPQATNSLKPGDVVKVSFASDNNVATPTTVPGRYTIAPGETLYHIAVSHGITLDQLLAANPTVDPTNYKSGATLVIPSPQSPSSIAGTSETTPGQSTTVAQTPPTGNGYIVQPGDTFYSLSRRFGVSVEHLQAANPLVSSLVAGQQITLPQVCDTGNEIETTVVSSFYAPSAGVDTIYIAMPIEFTGAYQSRSVDFLRGFMLAADSLRSYGKPVSLLVYDINSADTPIETVLADPRLKKAKVIVGPHGEAAFGRLAQFARDNGIYMINNFLMRDTRQEDNPYIMQASLPTRLFYANAADYFIKSFPNETFVFLLSSKNNKKSDMVGLLQKRLTDNGRSYMAIPFHNEINDSDLNKLPAGVNYTFVTNTDSLPAIASAIEEFVKSRPADANAFIGYHDWLRHGIAGYNNLENCNTLIFSRFFVEAKSSAATEIGELYKRWYGDGPSDKLPHWFACGFDNGMYLIRALNANDGNFRQNTPRHIGQEYLFDFKAFGDDKGLTNDSEVIITLRPGNIRFKQIM